jgi:YesN/AraC family two-component response regulator
MVLAPGTRLHSCGITDAIGAGATTICTLFHASVNRDPTRDRLSNPGPGATLGESHELHVATPFVLWIDDQVSSTDAAVRLLEEEGFRVHCAASVMDGLARLESRHYDALILDLYLPDRSGLQLLQEIALRGGGVPVVVLTGYADYEAARIAGRLGAARFEAKPLGADELARILRSVIQSLAPSGATSHDRDWAAPAVPSAVRPGVAVLSRLAARTLVTVALDPRVFLKYAAFLRLTLESSTPSEVELQRAWQDLTAHAVRPDGAAPNPKVAAAIERLERSARPRSMRGRALARELFVDPGHLARCFHADTGLHFRDWRAAVVMRRAIRRIAGERASISEIAWDVGFEHLSAFDREFVRVFGVKPTTFRRLYRAWSSDAT